MDENEVFENHYFIMIKRLLIVMCVWPYKNKTLKFYGRIFTTFAIHATLIPLVIKFYEEWYEKNRNEQILIGNFVSFLHTQGVFARIYMSVSKGKKLQHLFEMMTRDYKKIQEPEERIGMEKFRNTARNLCIAYSVYMFTALYALVFKPQMVLAIFDFITTLIGSRHKMICYYAEYFVDHDEYLHTLVLHSFVVSGITFTIVVAVDTSYMIATYHVLRLFNMLICRLKQLSEWADFNVNREDERLHRFIIDTIKIHNKTLNIAKLIRTTYDAFNFISFGITLSVLSVGSIDVTLNLTKPEVIMRIGPVIVEVILYPFFVYWPCQRFPNGSEDLVGSTHVSSDILHSFSKLEYIAFYVYSWYNLSTRMQFLMRFMMMRCLILYQLTAGPLFQMNFTFSGSLLRKVLSFFIASYSFS